MVVGLVGTFLDLEDTFLDLVGTFLDLEAFLGLVGAFLDLVDDGDVLDLVAFLDLVDDGDVLDLVAFLVVDNLVVDFLRLPYSCSFLAFRAFPYSFELEHHQILVGLDILVDQCRKLAC